MQCSVMAIALFLLWALQTQGQESQGTAYLSAQQYAVVLTLLAPCDLSYDISVIGGEAKGSVDVLLLDESNYRRLETRNFSPSNPIEYIGDGSKLRVVSTSVKEVPIDSQGSYFLIVWSRNVLFPVAVSYSVSAKSAISEPGTENTIYAVTAAVSVCACLCFGALCIGVIYLMRRKRALDVRQISLELGTVPPTSLNTLQA